MVVSSRIVTAPNSVRVFNVRVLITGANGHIGRRLIARLTPRMPLPRWSVERGEGRLGAGADVIVVDYVLCTDDDCTGALRHLVNTQGKQASRYTRT
jgi:hypothetical protein